MNEGTKKRKRVVHSFYLHTCQVKQHWNSLQPNSSPFPLGKWTKQMNFVTHVVSQNSYLHHSLHISKEICQAKVRLLRLDKAHARKKQRQWSLLQLLGKVATLQSLSRSPKGGFNLSHVSVHKQCRVHWLQCHAGEWRSYASLFYTQQPEIFPIKFP